MKGLYLFAAMLTVMAMAGCGGCKKNSCAAGGESVAVVTADDDVTDDYSRRFFGTYKGTLPCADCDGVKTTLKINDDTTYELRSEYLGKKDGVMEESGVYRTVGDVIELITPSSGDKTYYKHVGSAVILCDSDGMVPNGKMVELYVLKKQ